MNVSPHEKRVVVDHLEQVLCTGSPNDYEDLSSLNGNWFFINSQGNVGINLRNIAYSLNDVIERYARDYNPAWGRDFLNMSVSSQQRFTYNCYTSAMSRTGVKEYKKYFKRQHSSKILEKHESELKRVKQQLESSTMRKAWLESQIKSLKK